jgi:hypothetical protein
MASTWNVHEFAAKSKKSMKSGAKVSGNDVRRHRQRRLQRTTSQELQENARFGGNLLQELLPEINPRLVYRDRSCHCTECGGSAAKQDSAPFIHLRTVEKRWGSNQPARTRAKLKIKTGGGRFAIDSFAKTPTHGQQSRGFFPTTLVKAKSFLNKMKGRRTMHDIPSTVKKLSAGDMSAGLAKSSKDGSKPGSRSGEDPMHGEQEIFSAVLPQQQQSTMKASQIPVIREKDDQDDSSSVFTPANDDMNAAKSKPSKFYSPRAGSTMTFSSTLQQQTMINRPKPEQLLNHRRHASLPQLLQPVLLKTHVNTSSNAVRSLTNMDLQSPLLVHPPSMTAMSTGRKYKPQRVDPGVRPTQGEYLMLAVQAYSGPTTPLIKVKANQSIRQKKVLLKALDIQNRAVSRKQSEPMQPERTSQVTG